MKTITRRIFSFIIACIVAFGIIPTSTITVNAEEGKIVIEDMEAVTDLEIIPKFLNSSDATALMESCVILKGNPAYFKNFKWREYRYDIPGKPMFVRDDARYFAAERDYQLEGEVWIDSKDFDKYTLDYSMTLKINDMELEAIYWDETENGEVYVRVSSSHSYRVTDERMKINQVEIEMKNSIKPVYLSEYVWGTPKVGEYTVKKGNPAYISDEETYWQKKKSDGSWENVGINDTFFTGTYRLVVAIMMDFEHSVNGQSFKTHDFENGLSLKVNGEAWERKFEHFIVAQGTSKWTYFASPEIQLERPEGIRGYVTINGVMKYGKTASTVHVAYGVPEEFLMFEWERSTDGGETFKRVGTVTNEPQDYMPTVEDLDENVLIRAKVWSKDRDGYLVSSPQRVHKMEREKPEEPDLRQTDGLKIENYNDEQEYVYAYGSKKINDNIIWSSNMLTEAGPYSAINTGTVTVYTRYKETATHNASDYSASLIYLGKEKNLNALELSPSELTVKVGEFKEVTVNPIPADASGFEGILGSMWINNFSDNYMIYATTSGIGLHPNQYYKKVYVKGRAPGNRKELGVEMTVGYNSILRATCRINVATEDGKLIPSSVSYPEGEIKLSPGMEYITDLKLNPIDAFVDTFEWDALSECDITIQKIENEGKIRITVPDDCLEGNYWFDTIADGEKIGTLHVEVQEGVIPVESIEIQPKFTVGVGETFELIPNIFPGNASDMNINYQIDDTSIVNIVDGIVTTLKEGQTKVIISVGGKTAECMINVLAENVDPTADRLDDLWVGGVQMKKGMYLPSGSYFEGKDLTFEKPSTGYAYLSEDGSTLTLDRYNYEGDGYLDESNCLSAIYSKKKDLKIRLIGDNVIIASQYGFNAEECAIDIDKSEQDKECVLCIYSKEDCAIQAKSVKFNKGKIALYGKTKGIKAESVNCDNSDLSIYMIDSTYNPVGIEASNIHMKNSTFEATYEGKNNYTISNSNIDFEYDNGYEVYVGESADNATLSEDGLKLTEHYAMVIPKGMYKVLVIDGLSSVTAAYTDTSVSLFANSYENMIFDMWKVERGNAKIDDVNNPNATFVMPPHDVVIRAVYKEKGPSGSNETPSINISASSFTYNGKVKTPSISVKANDGTALVEGTDYTISSEKNTKAIGKYTIKVTFIGKYSQYGTKTVSFKINPKGTSLKKLKATKKGFIAIWKKQTKLTTGYQIQYAIGSKFKKGKTVSIKKNKINSKAIKKLKAKKKYYVRIRTFKKVGSGKFYSSWSKPKKVTTKK